MPMMGYFQVVTLHNTLVGTVLAISIVTVCDEHAAYGGRKRRRPDGDGVVRAATAGDSQRQSRFACSGGSHQERFSSACLPAGVLNPLVTLERGVAHAGAFSEVSLRRRVLLGAVSIRGPPWAGASGRCGYVNGREHHDARSESYE